MEKSIIYFFLVSGLVQQINTSGMASKLVVAYQAPWTKFNQTYLTCLTYGALSVGPLAYQNSPSYLESE